MTKRPTSARIMHLTFAVRWLADADMEGAYGWCDADKLEIRLVESLPRDRELEIITHELLHAYWYLMGLKSRAAEETAVSALARAVAMFASDNPEWLAYLSRPVAEAQPPQEKSQSPGQP